MLRINIENIEGKEGCKACGWSKEEKEGLEVALHRTQEQVWFGLVSWFGLVWLISNLAQDPRAGFVCFVQLVWIGLFVGFCLAGFELCTGPRSRLGLV